MESLSQALRSIGEPIFGQKVKDISKLLNFTIQTITRQLKNLLGEDEFIEIKNSKFKNQVSFNFSLEWSECWMGSLC